jgi:peroxiredoxin
MVKVGDKVGDHRAQEQAAGPAAGAAGLRRAALRVRAARAPAPAAPPALRPLRARRPRATAPWPRPPIARAGGAPRPDARPTAPAAAAQVPTATLKTVDLEDVTTDALFAGKKVVLFAVPGAFTPTCRCGGSGGGGGGARGGAPPPPPAGPGRDTAYPRTPRRPAPARPAPARSKDHAPGFIKSAKDLKAKGVDLIVCVSVNDAFVMKAWGESLGAGNDLLLLADGNNEFTKVGAGAQGRLQPGGIRNKASAPAAALTPLPARGFTAAAHPAARPAGDGPGAGRQGLRPRHAQPALRCGHRGRRGARAAGAGPGWRAAGARRTALPVLQLASRARPRALRARAAARGAQGPRRPTCHSPRPPDLQIKKLNVEGGGGLTCSSAKDVLELL